MNGVVDPPKILIYEALIWFLRETCSTPIAGRSPNEVGRLRETLSGYMRSMASDNVVSALAESTESRKALLELSAKLGLANDPKLRAALRTDEQRIAMRLMSIFTSESAQAAVLRLEGDSAQCFLDVVQGTLDKGFLIAEEHSRMARRIIRKLSEACDRLPSSLFITGVCGREEHPTFGGGYGDIYRASHNNRPVALKRMRHFLRGSDLRRVRLKICREALVWKDLHHPHILPFLGIDQDSFPSSLCIVSPWMEQGTVINYLKDHGHANVDKLLYEIAQGLLYLHSRSIVHGDLRGSNILINEDWSACLTDFGLSIFSDATSTMSTNRGGSIYWMAPELLDPDRFGNKFGRTPASDVYAFGCVCLELYTGRPPFSNLLEPAALMKVLNGKRPERPPGPPAMPDALWKNIAAYWAEKPTARPITQRVVRDMVWPPLDPKSARPRPSLLSALPSSPSSSSMKSSLGSKKRKYRWWNLRTPDDISLRGDSVDDDSISMPWNFQHHVHVDGDLTGLPPSWAASLRAVGFSDDEIALLQRRQLPDHLHDERFAGPVAPDISPPPSKLKLGDDQPLKPPRPGDRVTPMEEDMLRLFEECKLGSSGAALLSQSLKMVTLDNPVVVECHRKCVELQELLLVQIPWVSALAERSRIAKDLEDANTLGASVPTREEELLVAIRSANEQLLDALAMYDDLKRENEERSRREEWQYTTEEHERTTSPASSYSRSSSPPVHDSSSRSREGDTSVTSWDRSLGNGSSPLHVTPSHDVNRDSGASDVSSLAPRYVGWVAAAVAAAVAPLREFIDEPVDPREFYWDLQEIAEGESGSVFAATLVPDAPIHNLKLSPPLKARDVQQLANGRRVLVAVKSVALLPGGSAKLVAVKRECELLRGLWCEQVLGMDALYVDLVEDALWIRMELMERSLADVVGLVDEGLRLQEPRVIARFASDMLLALDFLQTHHIAHRDLRSDNMLLNSEGVLKLADFSSAVLVTPEAPLCNDLTGFIYWQAPEVRSGAYDPLKIDVWSVGATVWELAEAVPPFADTKWHAERWPALSDPELYPQSFHDFLRLCSEPAASRPTPRTLLKTPLLQNPCGRPVIVQLLSRCMSIEQALHLGDVAPDPAPWDP